MTERARGENQMQPTVIIYDRSLGLYYLDDGLELTSPDFKRWVQEHPELEPIVYVRGARDE